MINNEQFKKSRFCTSIKLKNQHPLPVTSQALVIYNSDFFSEDSLVVPQEIYSYLDLPTENIHKYILAPAELPLLSLTKEHQSFFLSGKPILIKTFSEGPRDKQKSSGEKCDGREKWITIALEAHAWLVLERLRVLHDRQGKQGRQLVESARDEIISKLIHEWRRTDNSAPDETACRKIFSTLIVNGQKSIWKVWFPNGCENKHLSDWLARINNDTTFEIEQEEKFQISLILSLIRCQSRAKRFRQTSNEIGKLLKNGLEEVPALRDSLAGTTLEDYMAIDELLPAVFAADFNPTTIFPVHSYASDYFDAIRIVGKIYRGYEEPVMTMKAIQYLLPKIRMFERWESEPFYINNEDAFWLHAMRTAMPLAEWKRVFNI